MSRLTTLRKRLSYLHFLISYRVENMLSGFTPLHIIVSGPDDDGAKALAQLLHHSYDADGLFGEPLSLRQAERLRFPVIVTTGPDEFANVQKVFSVLRRTRQVFFVGVYADPRTLVSERSATLPHHFRQGADYRLDEGPGTVRTFTQPGVLERLSHLGELGSALPSQSILIAREELLENPAKTIKSIDQKIKSVFRQTPPARFISLWRPAINPLVNWMEDPDAGNRVQSQVAMFPALEDEAVKLGYHPSGLDTKKTPPSTEGKIIAFHTPDDLYRGEAERLRRSLDKLGLDYVIQEVEPSTDWSRTTMLKPLWMREARETHTGPLLYIDVDAYVHENPWPYLSNVEGDMAAVVHADGTLNSSTVLIADTPGARWLLDEWVSRCNIRRSGEISSTLEESDQDVLRELVSETEALADCPYRFTRLPRNLQAKVGHEDLFLFGPIVIEQFQASRELRADSGDLKDRWARIAALEGNSRQ